MLAVCKEWVLKLGQRVAVCRWIRQGLGVPLVDKELALWANYSGLSSPQGWPSALLDKDPLMLLPSQASQLHRATTKEGSNFLADS